MLRWLHFHYRDHTNTAAFFDADPDWKEEEHPRGEGGKFAKAGTGGTPAGKYLGPATDPKAVPSYKLHKALLAHGFKKQKGLSPGGHFKYTNEETGQNVYLGGATPKQAVVMYGFRNKETVGQGEAEIQALLKKITGSEGTYKPPKVYAPKPGAKKPGPQTAAAAASPFAKNKTPQQIDLPPGFGDYASFNKELKVGPDGKPSLLYDLEIPGQPSLGLEVSKNGPNWVFFNT